MDNAPKPVDTQIIAAPVKADQTECCMDALCPTATVNADVDAPPTDKDAEKPESNCDRLGELLSCLKIDKIVFVDDKAELQIEAGHIIRVLGEKETAQELLAEFFPGVTLALHNDALPEQLTARLSDLSPDRQAALRKIIVAHNEDSAELEAFGRLQDLLPDGMPVRLLTPYKWHEQRETLIRECSGECRTLFLFDQELEVGDRALGFAKGSDIIRDMAVKEEHGFGTRWFCGILTHTVERGDEVAGWQRLAISENLDLQFFMPIAKATLDDALAFYSAVYRTLINTYCQTMKNLARKAFEDALQNTLERFSDFDPVDFEHVVVNSSNGEGVSELETLIRLFGILQKDQVKLQILQERLVDKFTVAARFAKLIADTGRGFSATPSQRLLELRKEELYESDQLVNSYHDPLRNGDLFEIEGGGGDKKLWVLVAQPCDLMVRSNGKRSYEENFKVAFLLPIRRWPLGEAAAAKDGLNFSLEHYDHRGAQSAVVDFAKATPANLQVLDLAVFSKEGICELKVECDPALSLPSQAWEMRGKELRKHFGKVTRQIEDARTTHNDSVATLLATAIIPRGAPTKAFADYGTYDRRTFSYPIRRCGRVRDALATSLLAAYSRFLARDAQEHDFSKIS